MECSTESWTHLGSVHCSRRDDELEVSSPRQDLAQQAHEDVGVERALVRLVEDDDAVAVEVALVERLAQHDTVRHVCKRGRGMVRGSRRRWSGRDVHLMTVLSDVQSSNRML